MNIDGKTLANELLASLTQTIQTKGVTPTLAVILVGDDPGSLSYVRQKEKTASQIGAIQQTITYDRSVSKETVQKKINTLNADPTVHGIIIQRPIPSQLHDDTLLNSIIPTKDVDGFVPETPFVVPVASAVMKLLNNMYQLRITPCLPADRNYEKNNFYEWVKKQTIVVIGRGETAGKPIADLLKKEGCTPAIITSQTAEKEKETILKQADIIISCVGKPHIIQSHDIKHGVILISVGITRGTDGKLHGDYEENDIKDIASYYTPTPGGVGPVNVACLMENLVTAARVNTRC